MIGKYIRYKINDREAADARSGAYALFIRQPIIESKARITSACLSARSNTVRYENEATPGRDTAI